MTPLDAAAIALLGRDDRRLLLALLRAETGRLTADDIDTLPPREGGEPLLRWACRARAMRRDSVGWEVVFSRVTREAHTQLALAERLGITAIPLGDARFPALLVSIADPPPLLWVRGQPSVWTQPVIAIVGSRAATPYAMAMSARLAADLSEAGVTVVSGLARGVDSAAHAAVIAVSGRTIGVLGCGVDRVYPPEHAVLARDMEGAGAVVSEFPPGVAPLKHHFPLRNRIISGLSLAVVVVEASEKSGALITASAAAEQGREVMVVPGPAGLRNRGGHRLLRDGARLIESADDILQDLPALRPPDQPNGKLNFGGSREHAEFTVDDVAAETGEAPAVVLTRLLDLELSGKIQRIGGGRFVRVLT